MGYYRHATEERTRRQRQWGRWLAVAMLSAAAGGAATWATLTVFAADGTRSTFAPLAAESQDANAKARPTAVQVNVTDGITEAVKRVEPAVMGVVNYAQVSDFFSQSSKLQATGVGTGVLFSKGGAYGYAVTNNHVVEGAAKVEVVVGSGKHVQAKVVGTDPYTDLAVLQVPVAAVKDIQPVRFADSDKIQVGEPAIAIGTPMGLDFADTVTAGIVSAKKRIMPVEEPTMQQVLDYQAVIQTDAAINPGNSGGPLVNVHGDVMGINSSKIVAQSFEGMGFAIPSNQVRHIADQILRTGHAVHPALGISGYSLSAVPEQYWPDVPVDYGIWVRSAGNAAKAAGIQSQDVIVGIDGHTVKTMADLRTYLFEKQPGQTVALRVYRGNEQKLVKVKLGAMQSMNTTSSPAEDDVGGGWFGMPNGVGD
ncbi:serine protease [Alicyclobacillus contaminans]|uniref:S1C family serine protease n=1 Tax=Alicyclobacillus contaminans TaxID=392016 RepID=UPI00041E285C|nr:trypsin-like peptidase domain-containing protein [Alicyclobacillus contaminans]GMA50781.1 serine protease [Alicyclobacillus contaminans]